MLCKPEIVIQPLEEGDRVVDDPWDVFQGAFRPGEKLRPFRAIAAWSSVRRSRSARAVASASSKSCFAREIAGGHERIGQFDEESGPAGIVNG